MSDNIPLELQAEIIKRVPVKALLKFRSVSKQWKSLIDSPDFADDYCVRQSQPHRLLIRYVDISLNDIPFYKYVSIADDDDTFQQHQIPTATLPKSVKNIQDSIIVGSSHGLFCLYDCSRDRNHMVVLWNPWIRKFVDVPVPNVLFGQFKTILGFGVSPQTKDPKIVEITSFYGPQIHTSGPIPCRVQVFSLSSGTWKSPSCSRNNLPFRNSINFHWKQVVLDGVIYWLAFEMIGDQCHNLIMSFDLSSEGFEEVCLPDNLARLDDLMLLISKRMDSVVVLEIGKSGSSFGVWMMGQGVTKSFTKLFTIKTWVSLSPLYGGRGFLKNGEPIVDNGSDALFAYDPYSERIKDLGIVGITGSFNVMSYMETLLLIDQ